MYCIQIRCNCCTYLVLFCTICSLVRPARLLAGLFFMCFIYFSLKFAGIICYLQCDFLNLNCMGYNNDKNILPNIKSYIIQYQTGNFFERFSIDRWIRRKGKANGMKIKQNERYKIERQKFASRHMNGDACKILLAAVLIENRNVCIIPA